ncbi:MAG: class I SAM-dependent methyltransferase [Actinomycetota bacterium]|nr:class I SAM-dependent methyltransferase [Actinomycetota bacterium]
MRPAAHSVEADETERVRRIWEKEAPRYDRYIPFWEKLLFEDGREWVCSRAQGDVLEVAIGTGRNLPFYPEGVRLTGVDISPAMLKIARRRAGELGVEVDLREADAQALPFPDASFDTVACTLGLCNIPDDRKAVAEMKRVLRPGGWLLLLDHVRSSSRLGRALQRALEIVTVRLEGDHLLRRPLEHVRAEGFRIERQERFKKGIVERLSARKPAAA